MVAGGPVWNVGILPIPAIFLKEDRKLDPSDLEVSTFVSKDPENDLKPFVLEDGKLYLQRYYVYQKRIVAKIMFKSTL